MSKMTVNLPALDCSWERMVDMLEMIGQLKMAAERVESLEHSS